MSPAISTRNYFAKATQPVGNPWRSEWLTRDEAIAKANKFVADWRECGIAAEACVFYRDGSIADVAK